MANKTFDDLYLEFGNPFIPYGYKKTKAKENRSEMTETWECVGGKTPSRIRVSMFYISNSPNANYVLAVSDCSTWFWMHVSTKDWQDILRTLRYVVGLSD